MIATHIATHLADAKARLMEQYKDLPNLTAIVTAFVDQIQELEDVIYELDAGRTVYGSFGFQLDQLGTLVGIERNGLDDAEYLLFILGKIGQNTSDTTIDRIAQIYAILLNTSYVQEQDLYPAAVGLSGSALSVDPALINAIYNLVQMALGAGIRLDFLAIFDPTEAFAFEGSNGGPALGFGDLNDLAVGGKFASLILPNFPFAFESDDPTNTDLGFGDLQDPQIGGNFQSL